MPWNAKNTGGYLRTTNEAKENAAIIASVLLNYGWSINAICGILGNITHESGLNPWRWESDYVPTYGEFQSWDSTEARSHGYGLFQFTPASKYINTAHYVLPDYSPHFIDIMGDASDGNAQLSYFDTTAESGWTGGLFNYYYAEFIQQGIDISEFYYIDYDVYKVSNISPRLLAGTFELRYEKPAAEGAALSYQIRADTAQYWYDYFQENPPSPVQPIKRRYKFYLYGR